MNSEIEWNIKINLNSGIKTSTWYSAILWENATWLSAILERDSIYGDATRHCYVVTQACV